MAPPLVPPWDVWRCVAELIETSGHGEVRYVVGTYLNAKRKSALERPVREVEAILRDDDDIGFTVLTDGYDTWITYDGARRSPISNAALHHNRLSANIGGLCDWAPLIERLAEMAPLCDARVGLGLYNAWQSRHKPADYERLGFGSASGFPLISDELPPPFQGGYEIDTWKNPGMTRRRQTKGGYPFSAMIGAEMWLGPDFWQHAGCTKADVLASEIFIEKRDTPHYLYVKSWPHPFTRPDGEQGCVQQKLWRLLFNEDCEWPPGSGGISDVPVGGPPELMPPGPFGEITVPG